jgi:phosphotriesterase-related protein
MAQVETVKGPVDTGELGKTLMHEHVFCLSPEIQQNYELGWDEEARVAEAVDKLNEVKAAGIDSFMDLTVIGLGRDVPRIQRIMERVDGLNMIVATGMYMYRDVPYYLYFQGPGTILDGPEPMLEMFVKDIEEGIKGTGIKAAMLKCAIDEPGLQPGVERIMRAVAQAHRQTGTPITCHTHAKSEQGLTAQKLFEEEGVDLSRIVLAHCGDTSDADYLERLAKRGSYLGMDRFGIDVEHPYEERVSTVVEMCNRGHADKMILSQDAGVYMDNLPWDMLPQLTPNWHYLHVVNDVIPELMKRGVSEMQIDQMMVENPRRIFEAQGPY